MQQICKKDSRDINAVETCPNAVNEVLCYAPGPAANKTPNRSHTTKYIFIAVVNLVEGDWISCRALPQPKDVKVSDHG